MKETHSLARPAKADAQTPWSEDDLASYLDLMDVGTPANQVIAQFLELKGIGVVRGAIRVGSKAQMQAAIRRHLRPANQLVKAYSPEHLRVVMAVLADEAPFDWTLETVVKYAAHEPASLKGVLRGMQPRGRTTR